MPIVRRGVSQRARAPEYVVLVPHLGIPPSINAEEIEVGEGAEGRSPGNTRDGISRIWYLETAKHGAAFEGMGVRVYLASTNSVLPYRISLLLRYSASPSFNSRVSRLSLALNARVSTAKMAR